ncbi:MAG: TolC family protein [Burkholderiales bacterium]
MSTSQRVPRMLLLAVPFALSACAGFSGDAGLSQVQQGASERLGRPVTLVHDDATERRIADLLARPLGADDAVQLALLNNKGLRASLAELGIAEADYVQAGRLPNPGFSFGRLTRGSELEIDRGISFNLIRLLTLPLASRIESQRFEQARRDATLQVITLASRTRKAWVDAVAAAQSASYLQQVQRSADAGAELARRMVAAGNWNKLSEARELGFRSEALLNLARAQQAQTAARERLTRLLGVSGAQTNYALPDRLPDLPESIADDAAIDQRALNERLDVESARLHAERTARNLGLTKATRFVNVLELGAARNSYNDGSTERGYSVSVELPLFDWGDARVQRAEGLYTQALMRAGEVAVNAQSELREATAAYRSRYEVARHCRDELVPLAKRVADENLLRYNAMLIGVFDLLADARAQIAAVNAALDAQRAFWLAQAELDIALIGAPLSRDMP